MCVKSSIFLSRGNSAEGEWEKRGADVAEFSSRNDCNSGGRNRSCVAGDWLDRKWLTEALSTALPKLSRYMITMQATLEGEQTCSGQVAQVSKPWAETVDKEWTNTFETGGSLSNCLQKASCYLIAFSV